jgi:hypothetical protein
MPAEVPYIHVRVVVVGQAKRDHLQTDAFWIASQLSASHILSLPSIFFLPTYVQPFRSPGRIVILSVAAPIFALLGAPQRPLLDPECAQAR